jgi:CheY-like chemotaxis protein
MSGDREKAMAAGCDDYDTKPVELDRLLGKINALLHPPDERTAHGGRVAELRHELRTPLNLIIGYCEMLLEDAEQLGSARRWARRSRRAGKCWTASTRRTAVPVVHQRGRDPRPDRLAAAAAGKVLEATGALLTPPTGCSTRSSSATCAGSAPPSVCSPWKSPAARGPHRESRRRDGPHD